MCSSPAPDVPVNLENSAVAIGLEKVSFHSNPKERQCQRMLKLLHSCTHLTCWQSNAQNSPSQASAIREPWTSRCSSWIEKRQRNQRPNCQHPLDHQKVRVQKNIYFGFIDYAKAFDCVDHNEVWKFFKRWEYQTTWPAFWEICVHVKKQQLKLDMEQMGSK